MIATQEFRPFPKIARLNRTVVVTEKIDGTNASIFISDDMATVLAGSRNRWITPESDNFGFATWVEANKTELLRLGPGHHFGEWWGAGIQRRYDLKEKRFSLFNVAKWEDDAVRPACCGVVPVLSRRNNIGEAVEIGIGILNGEGSRAAPGFMKPEGVVAYHAASGSLFKVTLENDEAPKGRPS